MGILTREVQESTQNCGSILQGNEGWRFEQLLSCSLLHCDHWTVTFEANNHCLSYQVIEKVEGYAYKTLRQLESLEDEWAIIGTFGMKLNATLLLLWVKKYYTENSLSVENLEQDIENLLGELECFLSHPKITTYDKAGFYSVQKLNFENVDREEFCRCAIKSAKLFRDNGRIQRVLVRVIVLNQHCRIIQV